MHTAGWTKYEATLKIGRRVSPGWFIFAPTIEAAREYVERVVIGEWTGKTSPSLVSVVLA